MAKYKIGDKVIVECADIPNIFSISEITEVTCAAGTQTTYSGRFQGVDKTNGLIWTNVAFSRRIHEHEILGKTEWTSFFDAKQNIALDVAKREFEQKQQDKNNNP
jgi:hypothetical protein